MDEDNDIPLVTVWRWQSQMIIRDATQADTDVWSKMRSALWPDSEDDHISEIDDYFAGSSVGIAKALLLEIEDQVAGFMELNIRNFVEGSRNTEVPYIEAWYVAPEYQARGFGKQLLVEAEKWALSQGYNELASDTDTSNEQSIAIHRHLGFAETERLVLFLKPLGD